MELGADFALSLDSLGPVHDRSVARAAPMRGDLLGPLVRRIHGVRPAHGVVVVRFRAAQLVQPRHQELGRLQCGRAVEIDHLVVCALQRAFCGCAVVADDVVDQRVIEQIELFQRIHQPANMVIGILHESGVNLHLPDEHGLELRLASHPMPGFLCALA